MGLWVGHRVQWIDATTRIPKGRSASSTNQNVWASVTTTTCARCARLRSTNRRPA